MRRRFLITFFGLSLFASAFYLVSGVNDKKPLSLVNEAEAYETAICRFYHGQEFDFTSDRDKIAVPANKVGKLTVDIYVNEAVDFSKYEGFIYHSGDWEAAPLSGSKMSIEASFSHVGNYRIAAFIRHRESGRSFYCGYGEAWVYDEEPVQTDGSWIGSIQKTTYPESYVSPTVRAVSDRPISGVKYTVTNFRGMWRCVPPDPCPQGSTALHNFKPSRVYPTGNGTFKLGYILNIGEGTQSSINFELIPVDCEGCTAQGEIETLSDIAVYTRPNTSYASEPMPAPPANTCTTVYGYVRDSSRPDRPGIKGAKVTAHGINNSSGTCQGGHVGCTVATTNEKGYWEVTCTQEPACLGVYETRNARHYKNSSTYPQGPSGSSVWGVNQIMWNNPEGNRCGPFIFFDVPRTTK